MSRGSKNMASNPAGRINTKGGIRSKCYLKKIIYTFYSERAYKVQWDMHRKALLVQSG